MCLWGEGKGFSTRLVEVTQGVRELEVVILTLPLVLANHAMPLASQLHDCTFVDEFCLLLINSIWCWRMFSSVDEYYLVLIKYHLVFVNIPQCGLIYPDF